MKDERSQRNNAWFTILLSKRSGFSDNYQRCNMKHYTRNNAWFTILLSKRSGFSDYYQR